MRHFLYILYSETIDRYYVGATSNVQARVYSHNNSSVGWTRRGRPWQLVFHRGFSDKGEALDWERWIKEQKSRALIERIVADDFSWEADQ